MNVEVKHPLVPSGHSSLPVGLLADRSKALRVARRHSRLVRIYRVLLPVCALGVIGLYFVSSKISMTFGDTEASVERIEVSRERLRMVNPKLEGINKKQGAYVMTADYAEQDVSEPGTIYLHAIKAETSSFDKSWSKVAAPKGKFYSKTEKLHLFGGIKVASSTGMVAHLDTADIDMKTQVIRSQDPVEVEHLNGTIKARTMEISMDERVVIFRGQVRVHLKQRPDAKQ